MRRLNEISMNDLCGLAGIQQESLTESKLSKEQLDDLRKETVKNGVPVRFLIGGDTLEILTGKKFKKGMNIMHQPVYWNFTRETSKKIAKMLGAKAVFSEDEVQPGNPVLEEDETAKVIKALRDTDYKDKDAFFKMTQLLKGLAVASEKDDQAKKFMSAVSDALTTAAKKTLGEDVEDLEESRFPKKAVDYNKLPNADGFWEWKIKDVKRACGASPNTNNEIGDLIFFLNVASMRWEDRQE